MGPNPNAFFCGFPSGLAHVTVQVATSNLLSRLIHVATSISCRDINLSLCNFELVSSYVATSILCRDITLCLCRFQLLVPDVATSIPCRDIRSCLCSFQLVVFCVATSVPCRDIISCFWRLQLVVFDVATSVPCRNIILDQRKTCHSLKALLLSRPPSLVATSTFVATSRCYRDIIH